LVLYVLRAERLISSLALGEPPVGLAVLVSRSHDGLHWEAPVTVAAAGDHLTVELAPIAQAILAPVTSLISRLVTSISSTDDAVTLRVDR